jgi:hypothetical protein
MYILAQPLQVPLHQAKIFGSVVWCCLSFFRICIVFEFLMPFCPWQVFRKAGAYHPAHLLYDPFYTDKKNPHI